MSPDAPESAPDSLVPSLEVSRLLELRSAEVIDLRSPAEFAQDHVPGARNVPLFDDAQRELVGTLYKRESPEAAFDEARGIVCEKVQTLVEKIAAAVGWGAPMGGLAQHVERMTGGGIQNLEAELCGSPARTLPERPVVLHCWRGGLRSCSVVALLRVLGYDEALVLEGGYRSYRTLVREGLEQWQAPPSFALRGLTGVGKTLVLRELERVRPGTTIDLEGLAGHRSSLLGMVGLEPCSQKTFDSRLFDRIREVFPGHVVYEGESRRVGDVTIPKTIWDSLQVAANIELVAPVERRVQVLLEDYLADEGSLPKLREQLQAVQDRMKSPQDLLGLFDAGREPELVEVLLEHYYDPLYRHSESGRSYALSLDSSDPTQTAERIAEWIESAPQR